jgi:S1-C subfamily serine protease
LALVKIEGDNFPTIPVGDSDALKIGEWVLAVGNPFNLNSTVTAGIVSAKARAIGSQTANGQAATIQSFIQTDAAINSGNSGGALVNARGELVGINAMLYSPTGAYSGYGFAIPTSIMKKVVTDLKEHGVVQRAKLHIECNEIITDLQADEERTAKMKQRAEELGVTEGVIVETVLEGGSSEGVLEVNDVIIGLGNKKIHRFADLQEALQQYRPGDKVQVKIVRDKKQQTVTVELKNEQGTTKVVKNADMEILGAAFKPISDDTKRQLRLNYGLQVTGVTEGKMSDAGIRRGFIILKANGQMMKSEDDLKKVFETAVKSPDQVLFLSGVFPSGKRGNFAVDLSQE